MKNRFPCSDEQVSKKQNIVKQIEELDKKKYGKKCNECKLYAKWCRCKKYNHAKTH